VADVIFIPNEIEMARLRSWLGEPGLDLTRRLRTLETRARLSAGVQTGWLRTSIHTEKRTITKGLEGRVGSSVRYALAHHQGTRPHQIRPRKGKALRFRIAGKVTFAARVNHPGTRPNHYLTRWLREAVR